MAVNFIDYEVLDQGKTVYSNQAAAIGDVVKAIKSMNDALRQGWSNETAKAFVDRIDTDHIPKLELAIEAINEVARYIETYGINRKDEDTQGAGSLRIG